MKKKFTIKKILFSILLIGLFGTAGCNEEATPSLQNMIANPGLDPQISSVEPPGEALAGVTIITINGSNFSPDTSGNFVNLVYFGNAKAEVLQASSNQLVVLAPNVVGDSLTLKVSANGLHYSNKIVYSLKPAVSVLYEFQEFEKPHGITTDQAGNVYVSIGGSGVKKITPNLELLDFAPGGVETFWNDLDYGPSGIIYGAKRNRGVWQIIENTRPANAPWAITASGTEIVDIDFDVNLNIWAGGENDVLFRIDPAGNVKTFPFQADVRSVRVFNDALYVGGEMNATEGVWVFPIISSDSLGAPSLYYDFSANYPNSPVNDITFSLDGDLYIGSTSLENPIIVVHPDKSSEELYPGVIKTALVNDVGSEAVPDVEAFAWGPGNSLYFTQRGLTIFKLNMQKPGAPYYGRD